MMAGAIPVAAASAADPMVALVSRYIEAFRSLNAASYLDGEGDLDGPITSAIGAEKDALEAEIRDLPIQTAAGFAAFVRYVHVDNYMEDEASEFSDMPRWAWLKIVEWAEARSLIG